ncbi:hypothetical protein [Colwellia sp. MB3u-4]|uniref:carboxylate--amine ligase n=1 Tax=Colwellia sp. MB3u-4 TaxID=2759822 RepID=UPI0015F3980D|nr:hypothetical protein [Colwellia sp. MB3u-4]MBA6290444.1 hypothetical protein [Colwellia sp. MB3u-4]
MSNTIILAAGPNGLGVVRSLNLQGIKCQVISRSKGDIIHQSRLPELKFYLDGKNDIEQHKQLLGILSNQPKDSIIIPTSDWFVTFLTENSTELKENFTFIIPNKELSEILIDKAKETEIINRIIPIPKTVQSIINPEQLIQTLSLPIIIKPRSHKHMVLGCKNIIIETEEQLDSFFERFKHVLSSLIAQEIIQGKDNQQWVCNCFFDENSKMTQAFTFNRLRLSPSHYGVTSYAISKYNQSIIDLSAKLGKALNYTGPAMIEFKQDPLDHIYKYIEINPRLGMCNYFDTSCGVNNAYATYLFAKKEPLPEIKAMEEGVIFMSLYEDLFSRLSDNESLFNIGKEYLVNLTKSKHAFIYFSWSDPYPSIKLGFIQIIGALSSLCRRLSRK